ncbi:MAG: arginine repressor [Lachnospiraceae bacterium]|nr:arginine repressor [Lachnospiraceae bacterium]
MKGRRQEAILELVKKYEIETQEELAEKLGNAGFAVTQATISRDIRELKLTKIQHGAKQIYAALTENKFSNSNKYIDILKHSFVSMDMAQNILVVKTASGTAMALATALDSLHWDEIVGTIAGDDTVMCAIRTVEDTKKLMKRLEDVLK